MHYNYEDRGEAQQVVKFANLLCFETKCCSLRVMSECWNIPLTKVIRKWLIS